ncbi:MAG: hypothetical protein Q9208_006022 [Pyrenodesmia sp. 3 TL-2023]
MVTSAKTKAKQRQVFPLMQLPIELRKMVYREMQRPSNRDHLDMMADQGQCPLDIVHAERAIVLQESRHRANVFVINKRVHAEATEVWYDTHFFQAIIDWNLSIEGESGRLDSVLPMPAYLPKIRNLEIHLNGAEFLDLRDSCFGSPGAGTSKNFTRLCYELAAQSPRLRNVVLVVPCACSPSKGSDFPLVEHEKKCIPVEDFEQLLSPLECLRVSQSITLESVCEKTVEHLQPVFDRLTALARTSQPVKDLEGNEKVWWDLNERARPFLRYKNGPHLDVQLCEALADAHMAASFKLLNDNSPSVGPGYSNYAFRTFCWCVEAFIRDAKNGVSMPLLLCNAGELSMYEFMRERYGRRNAAS